MPFKYLSYIGLGSLYLLILIPFVYPLFLPKPYKEVTEVSVDWVGDSVGLQYTFFKNEGCSLVTFHVEGSSAGVYLPLSYTDLDGIPKNFDRPVGHHGLNVKVLLPSKHFETIRIHTRHDCGGTMVNKVFTEVSNPNE